MPNCFHCKKSTGNSLKTTCRLCKNIFHAACANLTRNELELLHDRNESWTCPLCLSNVRLTRSNSNSSSSGISSQQNTKCDVADSSNELIVEMLQKISAEIQEIKQGQIASSHQLAECMAKLNSQSEEIARNTSSIVKCREDIGTVSALQEELKVRVETLSTRVGQVESYSTSVAEASSSLSPAATCASEVIDRATRATNVIMYGLPEAEQPSGDFDVAKAREICGVIDPAVAVNVMTTQRLGSYKTASNASAARNRPLKVTLASVAHARTLLRKKKILSTTAFKHISIRDDRTPQQMKQLQDLRAELKRRTDMGERNLTIKYKNGNPTIVTAQPKN